MKLQTAWTLFVLAVLATSGCRLFESSDGPSTRQSILLPAKPSPGSVLIEVFLVLVPDSRLAQFEDVWRQADEQVLGAKVRRELSRNGFRAGIIGPSPPPGLADLLQLEASAAAADEPWQSVPVDKQPTVTGHRFQMRPHNRVQVQASAVHDAAPIFLATDAGLTGKEFSLVQGQYALKWKPLSQGRIEIEVAPELYHGLPKNQYTVGEGNDLFRQVAKEREVFEQLRIQAPLSAGQMLLISGDGKGGGSLGHFFHTVPSSDGDQHRLIVIRLTQVPGGA
jgi:hypothetical protein